MNRYFLRFSLAAMIMFLSCSKNEDTAKPAPDIVDDPVVVDKGIMKPEVGGPNQPHQVFIKLATGKQTHVKRDSWDFGFYCGDDYRVIINNTIKMAVKELNTNDLTQVQEEDRTVSVGMTTKANLGYVDSPYGELKSPKNTKGRQTAIAEISANVDENKVYLVNMGYQVATDKPNAGYVALDGPHRGWKKIRITRSGNDYSIHYADLADTTFKTITVQKNPEYNFIFVNLSSGKTVDVQPKKADWDLSFTGITNYTSARQNGTFDEAITYYYADMVLNNIHNGTKVHRIKTTVESRDKEYTEYTKSKAQQINFNDAKLNNQLSIGDSWRSTFKGGLLGDIFYVLKDSQGNLFKIKFLAFTNEKKERGHPVFEYELLK